MISSMHGMKRHLKSNQCHMNINNESNGNTISELAESQPAIQNDGYNFRKRGKFVIKCFIGLAVRKSSMLKSILSIFAVYLVKTLFLWKFNFLFEIFYGKFYPKKLIFSNW